MNLVTATLLIGIVTAVHDGDTITVERKPIRLEGVDAPELSEPGGQEAAAWMRRLVLDRQVECEPRGRSYRRVVAVCQLDGQDIGVMMIAAGLARDCPRYTGGRYLELETAEGRKLPSHGYCKEGR